MPSLVAVWETRVVGRRDNLRGQDEFSKLQIEDHVKKELVPTYLRLQKVLQLLAILWASTKSVDCTDISVPLRKRSYLARKLGHNLRDDFTLELIKLLHRERLWFRDRPRKREERLQG